MRTLRLAVIGLSGSGKTTCVRLIRDYAAERNLTVARIALAAPLYELQERVYAAARTDLAAGAQDQLLLESLAAHLRRINPRSLVQDFQVRAAMVQARILVNDDLRDPHTDAHALRGAGFRVIRIMCDESVRQDRLKERKDLSRSDRSTSELDLIQVDAVIENSGEVDSYRGAVRRRLEEWL